MNTTTNTPLTMSSREIAELVGSRHDHVRVAIQRLAQRKVIALPAMREKPTEGRPSLEYVFIGVMGKRDSIIVVAQLSPEFTARLVDRWQELEEQVSRPQFTVPTTFADALRLAADAEEARQKLEVENKRLAPMAAVGERAVEHSSIAAPSLFGPQEVTGGRLAISGTRLQKTTNLVHGLPIAS